MIITKLRLEEEHPMTGVTRTWPLPLVDLNLDLTAGENGYILKDAVGIGPPAMAAVVIGFDIAGIPIYGPLPDKREIALKIAFSPQMDESYGSLRDNLYRLISRSVFVKFMNDSETVAQVTGFVRNVEPVHFSNKPEVQVTIECEDPMLQAPFPISIPSDDLVLTGSPIINYSEGTAPTGIELTFQNTTGVSKTGFSISNYSEFWHAGSGDVNNLFQVTYTIANNDIVTINTNKKNRLVTVTHLGVTYDVAGYLNSGAVWPELFPGVNTFDWSLNWVTAFSVRRYTPKYWGV